MFILPGYACLRFQNMANNLNLSAVNVLVLQYDQGVLTIYLWYDAFLFLFYS